MIIDTAAKPPIYIFDLDGTIANNQHRLPILSDKSVSTADRWSMFYQQCEHDIPFEAVLKTLHYLLYLGSDIWIWTGRSDEVLAQTREWLQKHCSFFESCNESGTIQLLMRPAEDYAPNSELKERWLHNVSKEDRARIVAVYEDSPDVVEMFRRNGVTCFQVANDNVEAFEESTEEEIIESHWGRAFKNRVCPAVPVIYIAKNPYSSIGKPASNDAERAIAKSFVSDDKYPQISFISQVRFIYPRLAA